MPADEGTVAAALAVASRTPGQALLVGVASVGSKFAFVGGPFAFVGVTVAMVRVAVAVVGDAFAIVCDAFAFVGVMVAVVGDAVATVGDTFAFVGVTFAFVGVAVALVSDLIAVVCGAQTFGGLNESHFLEPVTRFGRDMAKMRQPAPILGGAFSFVASACSFATGASATRERFAGVHRKELASLRCPPTQVCGECARRGGSLPKGQCDSLRSGGLIRLLPTVFGGHGSEFTPAERTVSGPV